MELADARSGDSHQRPQLAEQMPSCGGDSGRLRDVVPCLQRRCASRRSSRAVRDWRSFPRPLTPLLCGSRRLFGMVSASKAEPSGHAPQSTTATLLHELSHVTVRYLRKRRQAQRRYGWLWPGPTVMRRPAVAPFTRCPSGRRTASGWLCRRSRDSRKRVLLRARRPRVRAPGRIRPRFHRREDRRSRAASTARLATS